MRWSSAEAAALSAASMGISNFCTGYAGGPSSLDWQMWRPIRRNEDDLSGARPGSRAINKVIGPIRARWAAQLNSGVDLTGSRGVLAGRVGDLYWRPAANGATRY